MITGSNFIIFDIRDRANQTLVRVTATHWMIQRVISIGESVPTLIKLLSAMLKPE
jgi:hypothetical protein